MLRDDKPLRREQRAPAQGREGALAVVRGVGGVEEDDLEPPRLTRQSPELPGDVAADDVRPGLEVERPDILDERLERPWIALDEGRVRGPTRERLEPDAARPGEEIEDARVWQPGPERVHQRDAHLVGRRPRRRATRRHEPPALQRSRDHAHADRRGRSTGGRRLRVMTRGR